MKQRRNLMNFMNSFLNFKVNNKTYPLKFKEIENKEKLAQINNKVHSKSLYISKSYIKHEVVKQLVYNLHS